VRLCRESARCASALPPPTGASLTGGWPASTLSVFRPGSASPAAILFDAYEHYTRRSPKADEQVRAIRPDLAAAVDECIDAAGHEWEPYWQRRLLNVRGAGV
jgi:hypothetical protein